MKISERDRRLVVLAGAVAGILSTPLGASAQSKIYPQGTDCANQPTIAERLLCGRQEFRRQSGASVAQPDNAAPVPLDQVQPLPETPTLPPDVRQSPQPEQQLQLQPRTSSPNH